MARWSLQPGERLLSHHEVAVAVDAKTRLGRIYLTSLRLVVAVFPPRSWWMHFMGVWAFVFRSFAPNGAMKVLYQMRRDRFASVEPGDGGLIVFHDSGEGYAHVSFAITRDSISSGNESVQVWQQRMHAWASGNDEGATLPTATAIEK